MCMCDVRGPVDCMFQDMSNANAHLAQVSMPIIKTGFALAYRTGVNTGAGFWFVFLSLLSIFVQRGKRPEEA